MCSWGNQVVVHCPAGFNGRNPARTEIPVDSCIADLVSALNAGGILTRDSCCAHGKGPGNIRLMDGRTLMVVTDNAIEPNA